MFTIFSEILSVFLIMGIGFCCGKLNIIPKEGHKFIINLLMFITTPCLMVSSITTKSISNDTVSTTIQLCIGAVIYFVIAIILGFILCKIFFRGIAEDDIGVYSFLYFSGNSGFMGVPITSVLFGQNILFMIIMHNLILNFVMYSLGIVILNLHNKGYKFDFGRLVKSLINPIIISATVSLFFLFLHIHIPQFLMEPIDLIGGITVPLSMLVVGLQLSESSLKSLIKNKTLFIFSVVKMISLPILTLVVVSFIPMSTDLKIAFVFASVFPSAVATSPIVAMEGKNSLLAAEGITVTTVLSVITIPLFATLLTYLTDINML